VQACCIEYLILESDNLSKLFPSAHLTIGNLTLNSHVFFAILTTIIVMPTTWLRDLSCLSYLSGTCLHVALHLVWLSHATQSVCMLCIYFRYALYLLYVPHVAPHNIDVSVAGGVIASILGVICLFWVGAVDNVGFENKGTALNLPGIPIAIGLYGYCYSGHGVFPNIYSSLKNRNQFPSILFTW